MCQKQMVLAQVTRLDRENVHLTGFDLTAYPVLFWPLGAYLIIYRATSRPVEIVAVTQGARDIPAFLQRRFSQ
jgi:plasmid stabilization system protein ParE